MKWFTPLLLALMLSPLAIAAQHNEWSLVAHVERKKAAYMVLRMITQEIELIPVESLNQCEKIGNEIMKGGKLSKFLKGYKCIPGLLQGNRTEFTDILPIKALLKSEIALERISKRKML